MPVFWRVAKMSHSPHPGSLLVVHAAAGAPEVHIDYFGADSEPISFANNPTLRFGEEERFTLPANELRQISLTYKSDTNTVVFNTDVSVQAGEISSFYVTGDSANLSGFLLTETFQNYADSLFGVNFIHAADDLETISVRAILTDTAGVKDTTQVAVSLTAQSSTGFNQFEATSRVFDYTFQYHNASDSVLASYSINPRQNRREKVFKNITVPLVGRPDDGEGNSNLRTIDIDNF